MEAMEWHRTSRKTAYLSFYSVPARTSAEGQLVKRTGKVVSVPVGEGMIGRVVNALGQPIDGAGPITAAEYRPIESPAPGICERKGVNQPLQTGIKAIDPWFRLEEVSES